MITVNLYKNFSVYHKLNKNITLVESYPAEQLVEPTDDYDISIRMTVPTDTLRWDNVNYMRFDDAYYFIDHVEQLRNGVSVVHGNMDLLMTYRDAINGLSVEALRSSSHGSSRLQDDMRRISVDSDRIVSRFQTQIVDTEGAGCYILVTSQSGYQI